MSDQRTTGYERLMQRVLDGKIPVLLIALSLLAGVVALALTPREEEPQIVVPMADVLITAPGLSAAQVERQVATPLEKLLAQIDGVEHVYSMSRSGGAVVTVRFYVGEDREGALVRLYNKIHSSSDLVPAAVASWVVKPVEVDDVPILLIALWSSDARYGDHELRRVAEELTERLQAVPNTNRVAITGGRPREVRIELDAEALAARRTTALDVAWALGLSNQRVSTGPVARDDRSIVLEAGDFIPDSEALRRLVINVVDGVPVALAEVARIEDGPAEPASYTWIGFGPADAEHVKAGKDAPDYAPAVVLSVAKQKGSNAVWVARDVEHRLQELRTELLPPGIEYRLLRNYGETANAKVNDLVVSLWSAVLTVIVFIGLFLGWRAAFVVGLAIPICYGMTLGLDLVVGYTINRVTLFALILALGLLVDDPITGVDNIERFLRQAGPDANLRQRVIAAIAQVRVPLVMATVAIVLAFAPLAFITGMMGPYMAPMAFNVPVAVIASTIVSFLITPWIAYKLLPGHVAPEPTDFTATPLYRGYSRIMRPLIASRGRARWFLTGVVVLFVITALLPLLRVVPLKLLPFDNKDEFQVVIDMPEASSLERTQAVAQAVAERLRQIPEVTAVAGFVGLASPMDFNGLVRHYYLRSGPQVADLRVTLAPRVHRRQQTQEIAARIRASLADVGRDHGALVKLVLSPPGPPVIATIVAELYGAEATPYERIQQAAARVADRLRQEEFIVDVDTSVESDRPMFRFVTDQDKAALSGIAVDDVARTVQLATQGLVAGYLQLPAEANPLPIKLQLPLARRNDPAELAALQLKGRPGFARIRDRNGVRDAPLPLVPLGELGEFRELTEDTTIYHKDLRRVVYVFAEPAGRPPADAILDVAADLGIAASAGAPRPIASRTHLDPGAGISWSLPADVSVVWDGEGEWDITLRVFRDMGIAFVVALVGIFIVLQLQTGSLALSLIIMSAIPLTVIGIMPGFWLLNGIGDRAIAGIPNPVLFTATAMIGMIALAGIVVRNSVILVEFIEEALQRGRPLTDALTEAGAVRMRPVLLTAGTTLLGNIVITLDPIFSGLAWAIIFGITASTAFTLLVVPVSYYLVFGGNSERHT